MGRLDFKTVYSLLSRVVPVLWRVMCCLSLCDPLFKLYKATCYIFRSIVYNVAIVYIHQNFIKIVVHVIITDQ